MDAGGGEDLALEVGEHGGLLDRAGGAGERDEVKSAELERDPSPGQLGLAFGDPDEKECEPREQHVRADAVLEAVKHGAQLDRGLQVAEPAFGFEQVLVAERDVLGREVGV